MKIRITALELARLGNHNVKCRLNGYVKLHVKQFKSVNNFSAMPRHFPELNL